MSGAACVIVNPASGRGRGRRALPEIRSAFARVGITDVRLTERPRDEMEIARRAIAEGKTTLVACGGDGTWSNVANAILAAGADVRLALVAAGTGNDFSKTVGAPARDPAATARLVAEGAAVSVDVGRIEERHFLNIAGFGFDIAVLEDIRTIPWLEGNALYMYSALRQLFGYAGVRIGIRSAAGAREAQHLMLVVANARNFGGSFRIAPAASLTDGELDAVSILDASPLRRARLFGAVVAGAHAGRPGVVMERSPSFTLHFPAPPAYETDGEYNQAATATLEINCIPQALRVVA